MKRQLDIPKRDLRSLYFKLGGKSIIQISTISEPDSEPDEYQLAGYTIARVVQYAE